MAKFRLIILLYPHPDADHRQSISTCC